MTNVEFVIKLSKTAEIEKDLAKEYILRHYDCTEQNFEKIWNNTDTERK